MYNFLKIFIEFNETFWDTAVDFIHHVYVVNGHEYYPVLIHTMGLLLSSQIKELVLRALVFAWLQTLLMVCQFIVHQSILSFFLVFTRHLKKIHTIKKASFAHILVHNEVWQRRSWHDLVLNSTFSQVSTHLATRKGVNCRILHSNNPWGNEISCISIMEVKLKILECSLCWSLKFVHSMFWSRVWITLH